MAQMVFQMLRIIHMAHITQMVHTIRMEQIFRTAHMVLNPPYNPHGQNPSYNSYDPNFPGNSYRIPHPTQQVSF